MLCEELLCLAEVGGLNDVESRLRKISSLCATPVFTDKQDAAAEGGRRSGANKLVLQVMARGGLSKRYAVLRMRYFAILTGWPCTRISSRWRTIGFTLEPSLSAATAMSH